MIEALEESDVEELSGLLGRWLGHALQEGRMPELATLIAERVDHHRFPSATHYLGWLRELPSASEERRFIAEQLTVGETHFFRLPAHFDALRKEVLPERLEARRIDRTLNLVSAGCASGEEPYSLAIVIREVVPDPDTWNIRVRGVDVNRALLARAKRARYSAWSLRDTPDSIRARYFQKNGAQYVLSDEIRRMVSFEERNLFDWGRLQPRGELDVVFCRNVGIYMTPDSTKRIVSSFEEALVPGGYLFLGHAESLRGYSDAFSLRQHDNGFFYKLETGKQSSPAARRFAKLERIDVAAGKTSAAPSLDEKTVEDTLVEKPSSTPLRVSRKQRTKSVSEISSSTARFDYRHMLELIHQDKQLEALEQLDGLASDEATLPKARLVRAVILANRAKYDEAEALCREVLVDDSGSAAACHVLSLCSAAQNDTWSAVEHARHAVALDPAFGFAHLQLGLLTKRGGDHEIAKQALQTALELLGRERASRIVLFGGGFSRHALMELCRSEMRGCG